MENNAPFVVLLVALLTTGATAARAQGKCGLFSSDPECQRTSAPRLQVDFAKGMEIEKPARSLPSQSPARVVAVAPRQHAFDCRMIRSADRDLDPRIVKAPPSGVKYALRVITAPACPAK